MRNLQWHAEGAAMRVTGVKAMTTELKAQLTSLSKLADADVAEAAEGELEWTTSLPAGAIKVMVEGGCATLSGDVDRQYQRPAANDKVRSLTAVSDRSSSSPV